jgi:hypothetical protein
VIVLASLIARDCPSGRVVPDLLFRI